MLKFVVVLCVAIATVKCEDCMGGMKWAECGSPCTATCENPMPMCAAMCVAKCQCPPNLVWHNDKCQTTKKCPAPPKSLPQGSSNPCEGVDCGDGNICRTDRLSASNTITGRCVDSSLPVQCQFPMDPGPCRANKPNWFYNADTGTCGQFVYGGCRGNDNRFRTKEECDGNCVTMDWVPECGDVDCYMECPNGRAKDAKGCELCECVDSGCSLAMCMMECPNGFKKNKKGCDMCECAETVVCPDTMCMMECPYGFAKDARGCDKCACDLQPKSKASKCPAPEVQCTMYCEFGFTRDANDCAKCECAAKDNSVCSDVQCRMFCPYGFVYNSFGCASCECAIDPCDNMACPDHGTVCKSFERENGRYDGFCVPADLRDWCVAAPMCLMFCEHGFKSDLYGCPSCACADQPQEECPLIKCASGCEYGYAFDNLGCRGCECLPDPCDKKKCAESKVCEARPILDCPTCPSQAKCLEGAAVRRVHVFVEFAHEPLEVLNEEEFTLVVKERIGDLLNIDPEYIREVQVSERSVVTTSVNFHIVEYGGDGLITTYSNLKNKINMHEEGTAVLYEDIQFIPEHDTVSAHYSSDPTIPMNQESEDPEGDMSQLIIIIAVAAGVGVFVMVLTVILVTMLKKRTAKAKQRPHDNVKYKQAPDAQA